MKNTDFLAVTGCSHAGIYFCFRELAVSTSTVEESAAIDCRDRCKLCGSASTLFEGSAANKGQSQNNPGKAA
jgi:hypothetical protein